jgi:hypothetical protein
MPRLTPEATAAAVYRTGSKWPKPPRVLSRRAREVWREIVHSAPPDRYYGHLHQLRGYCSAVDERERIAEALAKSKPGSVEQLRLTKALKQFADLVAREGRHLRVNLSSRVDRKAGILDEPGPSPELVVDNDHLGLIGGRAISARWD